MRLASIAAIVASMPAVTASAQMAMPDAPRAACPAKPAPLPPELAGWASMTPANAAASAGELGLATLPLGRGTRATLALTSAISYPLAPEHTGAPTSYGGLFAFTVIQAGTYRVGLSAGAWIDVVRDGLAQRSIAHGHGPDCSGVRKMVDFALAPGRYTLQVAGNDTPNLSLIVAKLPA